MRKYFVFIAICLSSIFLASLSVSAADEEESSSRSNRKLVGQCAIGSAYTVLKLEGDDEVSLEDLYEVLHVQRDNGVMPKILAKFLESRGLQVIAAKDMDVDDLNKASEREGLYVMPFVKKDPGRPGMDYDHVMLYLRTTAGGDLAFADTAHVKYLSPGEMRDKWKDFGGYALVIARNKNILSGYLQRINMPTGMTGLLGHNKFTIALAVIALVVLLVIVKIIGKNRAKEKTNLI
jgi:hypothetical protein